VTYAVKGFVREFAYSVRDCAQYWNFSEQTSHAANRISDEVKKAHDLRIYTGT
jgi:hypothetical protein